MTKEEADRFYIFHEDWLIGYGIKNYYDWLDRIRIHQPGKAEDLESAFEKVVIAGSKIKKSEITGRTRLPSSMPEGFIHIVKRKDIRDLVEFLSTQ